MDRFIGSAPERNTIMILEAITLGEMYVKGPQSRKKVFNHPSVPPKISITIEVFNDQVSR